MTRTISKQKQQLLDKIDWRWPDALWVSLERHSDEAFTIWILDADDTYTEWLAAYSLDHRWTLSPRRGFCENDSLTL